MNPRKIKKLEVNVQIGLIMQTNLNLVLPPHSDYGDSGYQDSNQYSDDEDYTSSSWSPPYIPKRYPLQLPFSAMLHLRYLSKSLIPLLGFSSTEETIILLLRKKLKRTLHDVKALQYFEDNGLVQPGSWYAYLYRKFAMIQKFLHNVAINGEFALGVPDRVRIDDDCGASIYADCYFEPYVTHHTLNLKPVTPKPKALLYQQGHGLSVLPRGQYYTGTLEVHRPSWLPSGSTTRAVPLRAFPS